MPKSCFILLSVLFFASCQKQRVVKHLIPMGFEGPLIVFYTEDETKVQRCISKKGNVTYINYDSSGVAFYKYVETSTMSTTKVNNNYVYVKDSVETEIHPHCKFYASGRCKDRTFYTVDIVWIKDKEEFATNIDARIKATFKQSINCVSDQFDK